MHLYEVLRRPLITEKMTSLQSLRKYAFEVAPKANRLQVKQAVEKAFNVRVVSVNIIIVKGERKRSGRRWYTTPPEKKAIVTLKEGYKIQLFEGV